MGLFELAALIVSLFPPVMVDIRLVLAVAPILGYINWEIRTSRKHR